MANNEIFPIDNLFSQDYFQAREKFINAARDNLFEINSIKHNLKGPDGRDIFMDFAHSGQDDAKNIIIIISGTHGPEGYCGSAVQYGLLKYNIAAEWAKTQKILMVHAHNPYGFAWDIRFNEDNIDLNRNYIEDFSNPPDSSLYDEVKKWAMPEDLSDATIAESFNNLMQYASRNGFPKLQTALTSGQYKYKNGVYYGGDAPSWSNINLTEYLKKYTIGAENAIVIDIHSGLGNFGHGELITGYSTDTQQFKQLGSIWGDEVKSTGNGQSVSARLTGCLRKRRAVPGSE